MIGIVATITIKDGENAGFEAAAKKLVAAVRANEPDCSLYALHKKDENTYVFMERYADWDAVEHHRGTEHFKTLGRAMGPFMAGAPDVLRMEEVE